MVLPGGSRSTVRRRHPTTRLIHAVQAFAVGVLIVCTGCTPAATPPDVDTAEDCGAAPDGFSHRTQQVSGGQLHYVTGGQGPPVVLLHGFPETWWTWREVMPLLADRHTVIAPDLPGIGCSSVPFDGYDAASLAHDIHELTMSLGVTRTALVGHDTGGWVAYAYARQYRDDVSHLVLSGAAIPGFGLEDLLDFRSPGQGLPHLPFFMQPDVPEELIAGREKAYFTRFITSAPMRASGAVDFYAQSYSRPGRLTAALGQYRALYTDAQDNRRDAGPKLTMPTLALSGVGGTAMTARGLRMVARDVSETAIADAGHYVQEEQPADVASALREFVERGPA